MVIRLSPKITQRLAWMAIWGSAAITLGALLFIIGYVLFKGIHTLSLKFVFGPTIEGGLRTPIIGTIYMMVITLAIAFPLGLGTAIYLAEYAPQSRLTELIRYALATLAGIPSIIFGLFGLALFVVVLIGRQSILAGSLTLSCLTLPFIVGAVEEAIRAVPQSQREASLALGATKWQTIWRVVLPGALPGIITGIILCAGRVVSETAPLLPTVGFSPFVPTSPLDGCRTLALHLFYLATEAPGERGVLIAQAMGVAAILILMVIIMTSLSHWLSGRYIERIRGR